jgi:inosine-uridine nucleoside N-ribohydrolase
LLEERVAAGHQLCIRVLGADYAHHPRDMEPSIHVLALAPLTNIALAARMDACFPLTVQTMVIMGGVSEAKGNVAHHFGAEFNFYIDPEAAHITLEVFPLAHLVSWECTLKASVPPDVMAMWQAVDSPRARFFMKICKLIQHVMPEGYCSCDMFAAVALLYITGGRGAGHTCVCGTTSGDGVHICGRGVEGQLRYATVELGGSSRSTTLIDWPELVGRTPNVHVVTAINNIAEEVALALKAT